MKIIKKITEDLTIPQAILLGCTLIAAAIFFTVLIFFGGATNRSKLFFNTVPRPATPVNYNMTQGNNLPAGVNVQRPTAPTYPTVSAPRPTATSTIKATTTKK